MKENKLERKETKKNEPKDHLQKVRNIMKASSANPPTQMVVPVETGRSLDKGLEESQLNVLIETALIDRLKIHSIKSKKSLRMLVSEALSNLLHDVER